MIGRPSGLSNAASGRAGFAASGRAGFAVTMSVPISRLQLGFDGGGEFFGRHVLIVAVAIAALWRRLLDDVAGQVVDDRRPIGARRLVGPASLMQPGRRMLGVFRVLAGAFVGVALGAGNDRFRIDLLDRLGEGLFGVELAGTL